MGKLMQLFLKIYPLKSTEEGLALLKPDAKDHLKEDHDQEKSVTPQKMTVPEIHNPKISASFLF